MEVEMVDGLSAFFAGVDDDAVTTVQFPSAGDVCGNGQQMAEQWSVFGCGLRLGGDVLLGNDEQVGGGLRIDVGKADAEVILIHAIGRDFTFYDLAKKTVSRHRWI
jgi:hypothetical protein